MFSRKALLPTFGALVFACRVFAHSPYLLPNQFDLSTRDHVSVQASLTERFFVPDIVLKATAWHVVGPDGVSAPLTPIYTKDVAILDVDTPHAGTYRISTGARDGRAAKATIEGNEWKSVREGAALPANSKVYDTVSTTLAEVYVTRGAASDKALAPTNKGLEFRMLTHPAKLLAGAETRIKVLFDGKPVKGQVATLQRAGAIDGDTPPEETASSGDDGVLTLRFAQAGLYHVQLRYRFVVPGAAAKAESHSYALTLDVGE
jgi:hypothetical protein